MLQELALTDEHIEEMVRELHHDDANELRAAGISNAAEMLKAARGDGVMTVAACWNDRLFAVFGLVPAPDSPVTGVPWMLCTRALDDVPDTAVVRMAVSAVARMLDHFPVLFNLVHVHHSTAIEFVSRLGFTVSDEPTGPGGEFRAFSMEAARV